MWAKSFGPIATLLGGVHLHMFWRQSLSIATVTAQFHYSCITTPHLMPLVPPRCCCGCVIDHATPWGRDGMLVASTWIWLKISIPFDFICEPTTTEESGVHGMIPNIGTLYMRLTVTQYPVSQSLPIKIHNFPTFSIVANKGSLWQINLLSLVMLILFCVCKRQNSFGGTRKSKRQLRQ